MKTQSPQDIELQLLAPAFSLVRSLSDLVGLQVKFCGCDGALLPTVAPAPLFGPCAALSTEGTLAESCTVSHAGAIEIARSFRRPYIFTCHARLAAWVIPIICDEAAASVAIVCGGVLLMEPDAVLEAHLESVAAQHGLDTDVVVRSLDELPVFSREYLRSIAAFISDMTHAVISQKQPETPAAIAPAKPAFSFIEQSQTPAQFSLVFPPQKRVETKKEKVRRGIETKKRHLEEEVVRLLRERRRDEARRSLLTLLRPEGRSGMCAAERPDPAEIFTRLLRGLPDRPVEPAMQEQQAALLKDALMLKRGPDAVKNLVRLCERFLSLGEELAGNPRPQKLRTIQRYLEKNLSKKLSLITVGKKFGMKEKPLNELFLLNCRTSFTDYVTTLRIAEAKRLLETTDLTLGQIARKTGFSDQSYFTKVFKATAGMTPSEYRKK